MLDDDDGREGGYDQRKIDNELRSFLKGEKKMTTIRTRDEMREQGFGSPPPANQAGEMHWTIHRGGKSSRFVSRDHGDTWEHVNTTWPEENARRQMEAYEQNKIQRELK